MGRRGVKNVQTNTMKAVKTLQKYKCDFCKRRAIKCAMERHEKICFRNPNRFCDVCLNTGKVESEYIEGIGSHIIDCHFCSRLDKEQLKSIEERERSVIV